MANKLRVVVIDDHTLFREGLERLLVSRNIEVVASVGSGQEGIEQVKRTAPDVVLLDLRMPDMNGLAVLKQLIAKKMKQAIVVLTTSRNEEDVVRTMQAGAQGYLLKDIDPDNLVVALRKAVVGEIVFSPAMRQSYSRALYRRRMRQDHPIKTLTPREREALNLLAEGQSNKSIANQLGISEGTVKLHVKAILRKLGVHSRVEAAVMAVEYEIDTRDKD